MQGQHIGHYRLTERLGAGTYGEVWKGVHIERASFKVAIKLIAPQVRDDPSFLEALERECTALDQLDHPSIVRFRDLVVREGAVAMVLELLEGADLEALLASGPQPVDEVVRILDKVLDGLAYAHSRGVIHRDIKPGNIFRCSDGRVKLMDFGLARAADSTQATQTGTLRGTLDYMSPERFASQTTPAGDVYAVGLVAWELLAGRRAAAEGDLAAKMGWHMGVGLPDVRTVRPDCPAWLADVVAVLGEKNPRARPAHGRAALDLLRSRSGPSLSTNPPADPPISVPVTVPKTVTVSIDKYSNPVLPEPLSSKLLTSPETVALPPTSIADATPTQSKNEPVGVDKTTREGHEEYLSKSNVARNYTQPTALEKPNDVFSFTKEPMSDPVSPRYDSKRAALISTGVLSIVLTATLGYILASASTHSKPGIFPSWTLDAKTHGIVVGTFIPQNGGCKWRFDGVKTKKSEDLVTLPGPCPEAGILSKDKTAAALLSKGKAIYLVRIGEEDTQPTVEKRPYPEFLAGASGSIKRSLGDNACTPRFTNDNRLVCFQEFAVQFDASHDTIGWKRESGSGAHQNGSEQVLEVWSHQLNGQIYTTEFSDLVQPALSMVAAVDWPTEDASNWKPVAPPKAVAWDSYSEDTVWDYLKAGDTDEQGVSGEDVSTVYSHRESTDSGVAINRVFPIGETDDLSPCSAYSGDEEPPSNSSINASGRMNIVEGTLALISLPVFPSEWCDASYPIWIQPPGKEWKQLTTARGRRSVTLQAVNEWLLVSDYERTRVEIFDQRTGDLRWESDTNQ